MFELHNRLYVGVIFFFLIKKIYIGIVSIALQHWMLLIVRAPFGSSFLCYFIH